MRNKIVTTLLWVLIGFGFLGGLNVSYANFTGEHLCPNIAGFVICYIVTIAYGLMFVSLFIQKEMLRTSLFLPAWGITFLIALSGTSLELTKGDICPKTYNLLPLCFISLALCLIIISLFKLGQTRKSNIIESKL
jgi:hypothetical protein